MPKAFPRERVKVVWSCKGFPKGFLKMVYGQFGIVILAPLRL